MLPSSFAMLSPARRTHLLQFLKRVAPFSVVEQGNHLAQSGAVTECSKAGTRVHGIVKGDDANAHTVAHTVHLQIVSAHEIEARCSCASPEEIHEQWCAHAVALLVRSSELGFTSSDHGFPENSATPRANPNSPTEIAEVLNAVALGGLTSPTLKKESGQAAREIGEAPVPKVEWHLSESGNALAVRALFDGEPRHPALFEELGQRSPRELDNVLLRLLEDEGSWDEEEQEWVLSGGDAILTVIGLLREYKEVFYRGDGRPLALEKRALEAKIVVTWSATAAELAFHWRLPDDTLLEKEGALLGNGPHWSIVKSTLYPVTPPAAQLAALFGHASTLVIPRSRVGAILGVLEQNPALHPTAPKSFVLVKNPEDQPEARIAAPNTTVTLERIEPMGEHFSAPRTLGIRATLEFEYPPAPPQENVVFLPDRLKESECAETLARLGFQLGQERKYFNCAGDDALDLIHRGAQAFPPEWKIHGFEQLKKGVRFSDLTVKIGLQRDTSDQSKKWDRTTDWFECNVSLVQNNATVPLSALFKNVRGDTDRWVRLDSGAYARIPGGGLTQLKTTLGMLDMNFKLSSAIRARLTAAQAVSLSRLEDNQVHISTDAHLKSLAKKLKDFTAIEPLKVSKHFVGKLRSYQHEGLNWMAFLKEFHLGGILADEMGLGKTVQALALLQHIKDTRKKNEPHLPSLVVAPTSVITNWVYEARRFTPRLRVLLLHGPQRKKLFAHAAEFDLVITSYALLRMDRYELERIQFSHVMLDEAQNIKNPQAATTASAKALKARYRVALTGTPTENRPLELWSIVDFLMPGYLGSMDFFKSFIEKPILEAGPAVQVAKLLNSKTRPFILRRTKAEVEKDLPPKIESVVHVDMTDSQRALYNQILYEVRPKVFDAIEKKGVRGAAVSILAALLRLRQVCNHPNSIEALRDQPGYDSGKFNLFKDLVTEAIEAGRKILVFCQFVDMLGLMRQWLDTTGLTYLYLDGSTKNRQDLVDRFNADPAVNVFLISLKAGGTGLNLASADMVVIYDPWWNPAVEHQAIDRAHRIGQKRTVSVYRLVTELSIEQKIMELKSKKAKIVDALINENGLSSVNLTKTDLESLFMPIEEATQTLPPPDEEDLVDEG